MSFCRDLRWSPRWEARKIRCRRAPLSPPPIDGVPVGVCPLTLVCPKLSPRSAILTSPFGRSTGSASAVFRRLRSRGPVQPVRGARSGSRCLSAAGFRFSDPPPPAGDFPHGRLTGGGAPIGVSTFRMMERRSGWVPSVRRGPGARAGDRTLPRSKWPNIVVSSIVFDNRG
jgi:hypothetical protein